MMKPEEGDLVLSQTPKNCAILGGLDGVIKKLEGCPQIDESKYLVEALQYGKEGKKFVKNYFSHPDHAKFFLDLVTKSKFIPQFYEGRFMWSGMAVWCKNLNDLQDVIRSTSVDLIWDDNGNGFIVYPSIYPRIKLVKIWNSIASNDQEFLGFKKYLATIENDPNSIPRKLAQNLMLQLEAITMKYIVSGEHDK